MGESACWLHLVCQACGVVDDHLDADGNCRACRGLDTAADGTGHAVIRTEQRQVHVGSSGTVGVRDDHDRNAGLGDASLRDRTEDGA